jgi:SulP family sulfate permease
VPILFGIVAKFGYEGLVMATIIAGAILVLMGALKLGNLIKFIRLQSPGNNDSLAVARK